MNTCVIWLNKQREDGLGDEDEEWLLDVPEADVTYDCDTETDADRDEHGMEAGSGADIHSEAQVSAVEGSDALPAAEPASPKPPVRPIQMGEFLRKYITRRLQALDRRRIQCSMVNARQWGVGTAGGTEAIIHLHYGIEELYRKGSLPRPLAAIQIDQNNMFGNLDWKGIREAVMDEVPSLAASTAWKHAAASEVEQPDLVNATKNLGAEQGDAAAPLEAGATQAGIARRSRLALHGQQRRGSLPWCASSAEVRNAADLEHDATTADVATWGSTAPIARSAPRNDGSLPCHPGNRIQMAGGVVDVWFLDDGTVVCDPLLVVPYLLAFDDASGEKKASRNLSKSNVIIYAPQEVIDANADAWRLSETRSLAKVCGPEGNLLTLGAALGGVASRVEHFRRKTTVAQAMHDKIRQCEHTQIEMILSRSCLGVGKINHLLRSCGYDLHLDKEAVAAFDGVQAATVKRLFAGTTENGAEQSQLCAAIGGLGLRSAVDTALPANIASRILARPKITELSSDLFHAGLLDGNELLEHFDEVTRCAVQEFIAELDDTESEQVLGLLERAGASAAERWALAKTGVDPSQQAQQPTAQWTALEDDREVAMNSPEAVFQGALRADPASDGSQNISSVHHLQRELCLLKDNSRLRRLIVRLQLHGDHVALRRLQELRDPKTCHAWLWHIDPRGGTVLCENDFITAVRHRLGAELVSEPTCCRICGKLMEVTVSHALCCAQGESTAGHYTVVRAVVDGLKVADSSVVTEVRGLVEDSSARPADVYTKAALPGRDAALDITIAAQDAVGAGDDCCAKAFNRKLRKYARLLGPMARDGIGFRPMVWSAEGRPHPVVERIVGFASELAARKHPDASARAFAQRWRREIAVAIQKRLAGMVRACLPALNRRGRLLLRGGPS